MNISFVYPGFLLALALIAIPVIVHLFNFRRFRKVYFTNVKFLRELKEETTNRSRLKHLLVLLSRILAVTFLVLAFAQPFIPSAKGVKIAASRAVSVYIDNSFSMETVTREGTLLDVAKKKAREVAGAYKPSDRFQLLTNSFDPVEQRLISRDEFINAIDLIRINPSSRRLGEILSRQQDALGMSGAEEKSALLVSDFQASIANFDAVKDTSFPVTLIPVQGSTAANVYVDSCWFTSPVIQLNVPAELNVRITNSGSMDAQAVPIRLVINGTQKAVAAADVAAGNYSDVTLTFTVTEPGWQKALLAITDNPITFDDSYYFSFLISGKSNLLVINGNDPGPYLAALFGKDDHFHLRQSNAQQIDYSLFRESNVIFLNGLQSIPSGLAAELKRYTDNGGTVVVIPDSSLDFVSYGAFFNQSGISPITSLNVNNERVEKIMIEDDLFKGVFLNGNRLKEGTDFPTVNKYFVQASHGSGEQLMRLRSGASLLSRHHSGKGEIYTLMVPLTGTFSNFPRHALFVPVFYRLALLSEKGSRLAYSIGRDEHIDLPAASITGDAAYHLVNESMKFDVIPGHRVSGSGVTVSVNNQVVEAGNYELRLNNQLVSVPSFNFNRDESQMKFYSEEELVSEVEKSKLQNFNVIAPGEMELTRKFEVMNEGTRLWKYCIILVLLFLAAEIVLLKFWKT